MSEALDPRWVGAVIDRRHWHFHAQLYKRYGIVLAPGDFSDLMRALETGRALLIEQRGGGQAIYSHRLQSVRERIYVLAKVPHLITAWPPSKRLNQKRRELAAAQIATDGTSG